jgi:hypothetical protein
METVSLSAIVMKVAPEVLHMLTENERDYLIVLKNGLHSVAKDDVWEIIHHSIYKHQQQAPLH